MEPTGCVQVRTVSKPFGTESHPATVQLAHAQSHLQEVPGNIQHHQYCMYPSTSSSLLCVPQYFYCNAARTRVLLLYCLLHVPVVLLPVVFILQYCMYEQQSEQRVEDDRRIRNQPASVCCTVLLPCRQTDGFLFGVVIQTFEKAISQ